MASMSFGTMLPTTLTTPVPPIERIGSVMPSSPERSAIPSPQSCTISHICSSEPLASLIATMRSCFERRCTVFGSRLSPVRPGTL